MRAARFTSGGFLAEVIAHGLSIEQAGQVAEIAALEQRRTLFAVVAENDEEPLCSFWFDQWDPPELD